MIKIIIIDIQNSFIRTIYKLKIIKFNKEYLIYILKLNIKI